MHVAHTRLAGGSCCSTSWDALSLTAFTWKRKQRHACGIHWLEVGCAVMRCQLVDVVCMVWSVAVMKTRRQAGDYCTCLKVCCSGCCAPAACLTSGLG